MKLISIILSAIISVTLLTGCEKAESVAEETTASETTAATIHADLTKEEMAVWESMPEIVTMRVYNDCIAEATEILYITKYGEMKSFTLEGNSDNYRDIEWINEEIKINDVQSVKTTAVKQLIELYNAVSLIDMDSQSTKRQKMFSVSPQRPTTYNHVVYNICSSKNICILSGNNMNEYILDDLNGEEIFKMYLNIDPFKQINNIGVPN